MSEEKYKDLLLKEYEDQLKALSPEYETRDNLDWLWSSVNRYGDSDPKFKTVLCQLSIQFGLHILERPDISYILNDPGLSSEDKIKTLVKIIGYPGVHANNATH